MREEDAILLLQNLIALQGESEWGEFKENNRDPDLIGKEVSALSNMASLLHRDYGYLIYGVKDSTHELVGTEFDAQHAHKGNTDFKLSLEAVLSPRIDVDITTFSFQSKTFSLFVIPAAQVYPTQYRHEAYCRVQSSTKPLKECPAVEKALYAALASSAAEDGVAVNAVEANDLPRYLDFDGYFDALALPIPTNFGDKLSAFEKEGFLQKQDDGRYRISVLGMVCFAKDLKMVPSMRRRAVRVVTYAGPSRTSGSHEDAWSKGYALCFEEIISSLLRLFAEQETFQNGIRQQNYSYDELVLRECVANMLIHGDLSARGAGPLIEIFSNRVEFSNPSRSVLDSDHVIEMIPSADNEKLALFMHRIGIGDERGSGFDKIMEATERTHSPSPLVESEIGFVRVTVFRGQGFAKEDQASLLRDLYYHAVLSYVNRSPMTNASLRKRWGLDAQSSVKVARLIRSALSLGRIKPVDPSAAKKSMQYLPYWA